MLLTEKYKPKTEKEIIGQEENVKRLKTFLLNYKKEKKKAIILIGPSGTGKTCIPYALAHDVNWEILEVNASDFRDKGQVENIIGSALHQRSLFSAGKIMLVDEIDGLSGQDRGGLTTLLTIMETSSFPIIITASDLSDFKFNALKKKSEVIKLQAISTDTIVDFLIHVCKKERIVCSPDVLKLIVRRSGNDLRGSLNDLQSLFIHEKEITKEDVDLLSEREHTETIVKALTKIFKTTDVGIAIQSLEYLDEDVRDLLGWIDENVPKEYEKASDLESAYHMMSSADIFNRRIMRWQYWRFLVYINAFLSGGIAVAKDMKYKKTILLSPPGRGLKIFWANQRNAKKLSIVGKIPSHESKKDLFKYHFPYFKLIAALDPDSAQSFSEEWNLEEDELIYLKKPTTSE